jgi:hypothetical protein
MKALRTINNRLNWLSAGFFLAFIFISWLEDDKKEEKEIKPYEPSDEFMNIYNHYNNKETTNA